MRQITQGDVAAAARVLLNRPESAWPATMNALLHAADCADRYRKRMGRVHPVLGNGTLMAAALACDPAAEPFAGDLPYLHAMAAVIAAVLERRSASG